MARELKRGSVLLREWLTSERRTQEWIAEQIGTHQTNVSRWIRGHAIPLDMAIAVRRVTGIDVEEWAREASESSRNIVDSDDSAEHRALSADEADTLTSLPPPAPSKPAA